MSNLHDLAAAMRKGAALRPQCFTTYFETDGTSGSWVPVASCALGAAYEGKTGMVDWNLTRNELLNLFPEAAGRGCICPACGALFTVAPLVTHLNDDHHWTREAIADWLDRLEVAP
jgi:hypothetical protein